MKVLLLTEDQKNQLEGQQWAPNCYFNPTQDADGNWFISIEERDGFLEAITDKSLLFIWNLPQIDHNRKDIPI